MSDLGDFRLGTTIYDIFTTTAAATGAPTVLAGTPVVSVYENADLTQITAGITLGVDHDTVVGANHLTIVATAANGYEAGKQYFAKITTGTVGGTSAVGYKVSSFSIERQGTPAQGVIAQGTAQSATGTTLVLAAAEVLADNVANGMTLLVFGSTQGYWQSRQIISYVLATDTATVDTWTVTPSGTITYIVIGSPPASASGTLPAVNATQFAGQTITAGAGVTLPSSVASPTNITAGTIATVTALTNLPTIPANWLTAAGIAADVTTELQSGLATSAALSTVSGLVDDLETRLSAARAGYLDNLSLGAVALSTQVDALEAAAIAIEADTQDIQTRLPAVLVAGRIDASVGAMAANVMTAAAAAADLTTELQAGLATPTNITAGTITTVTNLTNAPTAGDLTATMKTSVTTAVPTAAAVATAVATTAMTEAYSTDGSTMTPAQAAYEILALLSEFAVSGVTLTTKRRDGTTTAATYTLDSATAPTSITRAT